MSFSPNLGRWMEVDPKGFDAGDSNLYRDVGNNPTNKIDPSGLEGVKANVTSGKNEEAGFWRVFNALAYNCPKRSTLLKDCMRLKPKDLPEPPKGFVIVGVGQCDHKIWKPQDKVLLGPRGAGPCVGLILIPPKPGAGEEQKDFYAFHFGSGCDPVATIVKLGGCKAGTFTDKYKGYRAVVCGAQPSPNDNDGDEQIRWTLNYTFLILRDNGIKDCQYIPGPNALVDKDGKVYWDVPAGLNLEGYDD